MKKKFAYLFMAGLLAGSFALQTLSVSASGSFVVKVGAQVAVPSSDIRPGGTLTQDEAEKAYSEFRESHSSNSTNVDTNADEIAKLHLPDMSSMSEEELRRKISNPTLTYEEFMEMLSTLSKEQQDKYKERLKVLQDDHQNKRTEEEEKFIEDIRAIYDAEKNGGRDGNGATGDDTVYSAVKKYVKEQFGVEVDSIDEAIDVMLRKHIEGMRENYQRQIEGPRKVMEESVTAKEEAGVWEEIECIDIDESEYSGDERNADATGIGDLYICSKCGKPYGQLSHCDCGKTLQYMNDTKKNLAPIGEVDEDGYLMVDTDDPVGFQYMIGHTGSAPALMDPSLGVDAYGVPYTYCTMTGIGGSKGYIVCEYCKRVANIKNIESWLVQYDDHNAGYWICHDCYYNTGEPKALDDAARDPETGKWITNDTHLYTYAYTGHLNITPADAGNGHEIVKCVGIKGIYHDEEMEADEEKKDAELNQGIAEVEQMYESMRKSLSQADDYFNGEWPESIGGWSDGDVEKYIRSLREASENGIPASEGQEDPGSGDKNEDPESEKKGEDKVPEKKVKDSEEYDEYEKKVFGNWPADQDKWTQKQKEIYEEYQKYKNSQVMEDMKDAGVFDGEDAEEKIEKLDNFQSRYTSISDDISTTMIIECNTGSANVHTEEKTVIGLGRFDVFNSETGEKVAWNDMWDMTTRCIWHASKIGRYTIRREVTVYDVQWKYTEYKAHVKWLVDGCEDLEPIYDKETSIIREDSTGTNARNARKVRASDVHVRVVPSDFELDNTDDFTTERIR